MIDTSQGIPVIDGLQYANWSEKVFRQMREGGVAAIHATICYHEDFRETVSNMVAWNRRFEQFSDLIFPLRSANDAERAMDGDRIAILFGCQNCSPVENDIGLVEICRQLGICFMQLSYNNQSLLASGCYETEDSGITRMGRQVIQEMNRVGMVVDMSHSGEKSTLQAIEISNRPIAVTHANPASWHCVPRNKSNEVLEALAESGGMLGFSIYPHHLRGGPACTLEEFCSMIADTVNLMGIDHVGFGSDLCQDQPDEVVFWMRDGKWKRKLSLDEDSAPQNGFPDQPAWFRDNRDFQNILEGLRHAGFSRPEIEKIAHGNWLRFFRESFGPRCP